MAYSTTPKRQNVAMKRVGMFERGDVIQWVQYQHWSLVR